MSLINDALKRAKEAQGRHPTSPLQSAPLHPTQTERRFHLWPLVVLLVVAIVAVAQFISWQRRNHERSHESAPTELKAPSQTATAAPATASTQSKPSSSVEKIDGIVNSPTVTVPTPATRPPAAVAAPPASPTVVPPPAKTPPPPLKLQGIIYRQKNPAAVINGKMLSIGNRVGETRIVAIRPESVSVMWNGQTNVLTMP